jgi:hypothetical protein
VRRVSEGRWIRKGRNRRTEWTLQVYEKEFPLCNSVLQGVNTRVIVLATGLSLQSLGTSLEQDGGILIIV